MSLDKAVIGIRFEDNVQLVHSGHFGEVKSDWPRNNGHHDFVINTSPFIHQNFRVDYDDGYVYKQDGFVDNRPVWILVSDTGTFVPGTEETFDLPDTEASDLHLAAAKAHAWAAFLFRNVQGHSQAEVVEEAHDLTASTRNRHPIDMSGLEVADIGPVAYHEEIARLHLEVAHSL